MRQIPPGFLNSEVHWTLKVPAALGCTIRCWSLPSYAHKTSLWYPSIRAFLLQKSQEAELKTLINIHTKWKKQTNKQTKHQKNPPGQINCLLNIIHSTSPGSKWVHCKVCKHQGVQVLLQFNGFQLFFSNWHIFPRNPWTAKLAWGFFFPNYSLRIP